MTEEYLDSFVDLLKNPKRDWPTFYTQESTLCKQAADIITELREHLKEAT